MNKVIVPDVQHTAFAPAPMPWTVRAKHRETGQERTWPLLGWSLLKNDPTPTPVVVVNTDDYPLTYTLDEAIGTELDGPSDDWVITLDPG